jgi:hypothetical protein
MLLGVMAHMQQDHTVVSGAEFAAFARDRSEHWSLLTGVMVRHKTLGLGTVTAVVDRPKYIPLLTIHFGKRGNMTFNTEAFMRGLFGELLLPPEALQQFFLWQEAARLAPVADAEDSPDVEGAPEVDGSPDAGTEQRHKERLARLGKEYMGIRPVMGARPRRVTHCYSCKGRLDNSIDIECVACGWILCGCGACGCGFGY